MSQPLGEVASGAAPTHRELAAAVIFWCSLLRLVGPFQKKRGVEEKRGGWGADIIKNIVISFQISLLILKTMTMHLLISSAWQRFSFWPRIAR